MKVRNELTISKFLFIICETFIYTSVLEEIISLLAPRDIISLTSTCKFFHHMKLSDKVWALSCYRRFQIKLHTKGEFAKKFYCKGRIQFYRTYLKNPTIPSSFQLTFPFLQYFANMEGFWVCGTDMLIAMEDSYTSRLLIPKYFQVEKFQNISFHSMQMENYVPLNSSFQKIPTYLTL